MNARCLARRLLLAAAGAVGVLLLAGPVASAVDVWSNVAPASQLPPGSLMDAYPIGNYALDHHFSAIEAGVLSGVDVSGLAPTVAWMLAVFIWQITVLLALAVISLFTFAFSLDLVSGSAATGGAGALQPVSDAVRSIYRDVFGGPWLTVAVLLAGMWSMWNALVRRRYTETAGALGISLLCIVIALAFVTQPERTIGTASRWTNDISASFLSVTNEGTVGGHEQAKGNAADHLFELFVYRPWVVLQFGGLEHCARDGQEVRVRPLAADPGRDVALARRLATSEQIEAENKTCVNSRRKYAPHFLRFAPDSDERNAEYEALKDGDEDKLPDADPGKRNGSYQLSEVDMPAAEAMGKGGQYQRLGLAVLILAGELGGFLLLGSIAVSVILAQVLALLLLAFSPVALVVGTFPGRGHQFFWDWLTRLATFLIKKAVYSLILAVLLAVSAALQTATSNLGWLMAWGLQSVYFWAVFLNRRQLVGGLTSTITGTSTERAEGRLVAGVAAGYAFGQMALRVLKGKQRPQARADPRGMRRPSIDGPRGDLPPEPIGPAPDRPRPRPDSDGEVGSREPSENDSTSGERTSSRPSRGTSGGSGPSSGSDEKRTVSAGSETRRHDESADAETPPAPAAPEEREAGSRLDRASPEGAEQPSATAQTPSKGGERPPSGGAREELPTPSPPAPIRAQPHTPSSSAPASSASPSEASGSERAGRSPLQDGLRTDAARIHRDALRLHHDAAQLKDAEPARPKAPPRSPTAPPSRAPRRTGERS
ncbi:MAG TPA: type IV secretion system protein [Conexibacter sp.]|nr:type IV secretion system protein [Conexibacter sp.]